MRCFKNLSLGLISPEHKNVENEIKGCCSIVDQTQDFFWDTWYLLWKPGTVDIQIRSVLLGFFQFS